MIPIYFDCETYTTKRFKHIPYLVCLKDENGTASFKSKRVFEEMLDHLAQKYGGEQFSNHMPTMKMYAHNSTYDGSFMLRHLMNLRILEKDNKYASMKGDYCYWKGLSLIHI